MNSSTTTTTRVGVTGGGLHAAALVEHFAAGGHEVIVHGTANQLRAVHLKMLVSLANTRPSNIPARRHRSIDLLAHISYTDDIDDLSTCAFLVGATDPARQRPLRSA